MDFEKLSKYLNRGEQWGFVTIPDSPDYVGWVLVTKRSPPPIYPYYLTEASEKYQHIIQMAAERVERPFHVQVLELRRDVHESGDYESTEDYRVRNNYYYATLEEVLEFFVAQDLQLENIKSRFDIDAP